VIILTFCRSMNSLSNSKRFPRWMRHVLLAAGLYNMVWGASVILAPAALFKFAEMPLPVYPQIWQCVGMVVGVYGVGYLIAASDPLRHWPITLVGLLGKIFGPIGFLGALHSGELPLAFGLTLVSNDLIWWVPFTVILYQARKSSRCDTQEANRLTEARDGHELVAQI